MTTTTVPSKFNGPPASGNGGYSSGVFATAFEAAFGGPATVSLRSPVPLDEPLDSRADDDGVLRVFGSGTLIAEAEAAPLLAPWDGPTISMEEAEAARDRFAAPIDGTFDRCFVCGRSRHDGFGVFTGPLAADGVVASPWTPPAWAADEDGEVRPEFIWSALDCPGYFAIHGGDLAVAYLVRQQVEVVAAPRAGGGYVVAGRALERSGRKGLAATAILDPSGKVLAHGECLLVVPR